MGVYFGTTSIGLESALVSELKGLDEKCKILQEYTFHGGVVFDTELPPQIISTMRSPDSVYAYLSTFTDVPHKKDEAMAYFMNLASRVDWIPALKLYKEWQKNPIPVKAHEALQVHCVGARDTAPQSSADKPSPSMSSSDNGVSEWDVSFRVTCERICHKTKKHEFTSAEAAGGIGHGVHTRFGWPANMRRFSLEVQCWILDSKVMVVIPLLYSERNERLCLMPAVHRMGKKEEEKELPNSSQGEINPPTKLNLSCSEAGEVKKPRIKGAWKENGNKVQAKSHHADRQLYAKRKYRAALVRTALKPSTAYALLQLADVKTGHIVMDPMCGGATIPLEASDWLTSRLFSIGGDSDSVAVEASRINCQAARGSDSLNDAAAACDVVQWDASNLPVRRGSVDRIICDMPFGVRCGSVKMREKLSPLVAREVVRVLALETGLGVLMSQSKSMTNEICSLAAQGWVDIIHEHLSVEMEGIRVSVMVIQRTGKL